VAVALLVIDKVVSVATAEPEVGHFRSAAGRAEYVRAYDAALADLPAPDRTVDVTTSFGTVRVYAWRRPGTQGRTPVVLLPGRSSGVPMWGENIPDFIKTHPVYAFDALGDVGRSIQSAPLVSPVDQAVWVDETLAGLKLERVHLVGHSFGGSTAAITARPAHNGSRR